MSGIIIPELNYIPQEDEEDVDGALELEDAGEDQTEDEDLEDGEEVEDSEDSENEDDQDEEDDDESSENTDETELVSPLYKMLHNQNYFFNIKEEDKDKIKEPKTLDEFIEMVNTRNAEYDKATTLNVETRVVGKFPTRMQKVAKAMLTNPDPITDEVFLELVTQAYENQTEFQESDLDKEDAAEKFMIAKLVKDNYDQDLAEDIVAGLKDKGKLIERAKLEYKKDSSAGNAIIDKFVDSVEKNVKAKQQQQEDDTKAFLEGLDSTGWSEAKKEAIKKDYASGVLNAKIRALINNPKLRPYLLDFASFTDGKEMYLDKYKEHAFSKTKKQVSKEITDKSFFRNNKRSTSNIKKKNDDDQVFTGIELITN